MNPLIEYALKNISADVEEAKLDKVEEWIPALILSTNVSAILAIRKVIQDIICDISLKIEDLNSKSEKVIKAIGAKDDINIELDTWEFRRPMIYKKERAEDLLKRINKLIGA